MLRIDVDGDDFPARSPTRNYADSRATIPSPASPSTGDDEIWAYGLRNPFRDSFDRATGDLWIGDVGQGAREEIDFQAAGRPAAQTTAGGSAKGLIATPTPGGVGGAKPRGQRRSRLRLPSRPAALGGITVTGGYVYRGPDPTLQGKYFFGDAGQPGNASSVKIWTFSTRKSAQAPCSTRNTVLLKDGGAGIRLASFGEDAVGNLYTVYFQSGEVYRIVTDAFAPGDFTGDGIVNAADLTRWAANFGTTTGATPSVGNADGDGDVDGNDFLAWQRNRHGNPRDGRARAGKCEFVDRRSRIRTSRDRRRRRPARRQLVGAWPIAPPR